MRSLWRVLGASFGGYAIAMAVAAIGAFAAGVAFPQSADAPPTTAYLSVSVAAGFIGALVSGYVCSRMAPEGLRLIAVALLLALFLGMAVAIARLMPVEARGPFGFLPLVTMLGVIGAWAGAMTERAIHATSREIFRG